MVSLLYTLPYRTAFRGRCQVLVGQCRGYAIVQVLGALLTFGSLAWLRAVQSLHSVLLSHLQRSFGVAQFGLVARQVRLIGAVRSLQAAAPFDIAQ